MANISGHSAKYYPQTDLHVALMFLVDVHNSITIVADRLDYFPYIRREIYHVLGQPSWSEHDRLRYSNSGDDDANAKTIHLVSLQSDNYEQKTRGVVKESIFYVKGWQVDDVRHNPYCACDESVEEVGYYHGTDGRLHASVLCSECGKRIKDYKAISLGDVGKANRVPKA